MEEEKTMSSQDLLDKRIHENYVELGKLKSDDPKRRPIVDEIEKLTKVQRSDAIVQQQKINANVKNALDDRKVQIAIERAKLDKQRIRVEYVKMGLFTSASFLMGFSSHFIDEWFSPDRTLGKAKEEFLKLIIRK